MAALRHAPRQLNIWEAVVKDLQVPGPSEKWVKRGCSRACSSLEWQPLPNKPWKGDFSSLGLG